MKAYDAFWPPRAVVAGDGQEDDGDWLIRAEATPNYISSHVACERIAEMLGGPDANTDYRLILMLREPVSRSWSEYHMKQRRVEDSLRSKKVSFSVFFFFLAPFPPIHASLKYPDQELKTGILKLRIKS